MNVTSLTSSKNQLQGEEIAQGIKKPLITELMIYFTFCSNLGHVNSGRDVMGKQRTTRVETSGKICLSFTQQMIPLDIKHYL